jgi:hypothetical protein
MATTINLAVLAASGTTCNVLSLPEYQSGIVNRMPADAYSVVASMAGVPYDVSMGVVLFDGRTVVVCGTSILSVSPPDDGTTYSLNIPLQIAGDSTVVYVQLQLGTDPATSQNSYGSKCSPVSAKDGVYNEPWDSMWYGFGDWNGLYVGTLLPGTPTNCVGAWNWRTESGKVFQLYLFDATDGGAETLCVMITDHDNDPNGCWNPRSG